MQLLPIGFGSFIWNQFCDWYLEASKSHAHQSLPTMVALLVNSLIVMHPFMPFVTESLWQTLKDHPKLTFDPSLESIISASWPEMDETRIDSQKDLDMTFLMDLIRDIRHVRKSVGVPESKQAAVTLMCQTEAQKALLEIQY